MSLEKELREAAGKATAGTWGEFVDEDCYTYLKTLSGHTVITGRIIQDEDSEYLCLCQPKNILALLDKLERMEKALKPFANMANGYDDKIDPDDRPVGPFALRFSRDARAALKD